MGKNIDYKIYILDTNRILIKDYGDESKANAKVVIFDIIKRIVNEFSIDEVLDNIVIDICGTGIYIIIEIPEDIFTNLIISNKIKNFNKKIATDFNTYFELDDTQRQTEIHSSTYQYKNKNISTVGILQFLAEKEEELNSLETIKESINIPDVMKKVENNIKDYEALDKASDISFDYDKQIIVGRHFGGISNWGWDESKYSEEELETMWQDLCDAEIPNDKAFELIDKFVYNMRNKEHVMVYWTNYEEKAYSEFAFIEPTKVKVRINKIIQNNIKEHIISMPDFSKYAGYKLVLKINRSDDEIKSILQNCIQYGQCSTKQFKYVKFACLILIDMFKQKK